MLPGGAPETSLKEWRYNLQLKAFKPPQQLNLRNMQRKEKKGISTVFVFAVFLVAACMSYIPPPNFFITVLFAILSFDVPAMSFSRDTCLLIL